MNHFKYRITSLFHCSYAKPSPHSPSINIQTMKLKWKYRSPLRPGFNSLLVFLEGGHYAIISYEVEIFTRNILKLKWKKNEAVITWNAFSANCFLKYGFCLQRRYFTVKTAWRNFQCKSQQTNIQGLKFVNLIKANVMIWNF